MAVLTDIRRIHMRGVLTGGVSAIVATEAISSDIGVVEDSRYPKRAYVAIVALFARNDVAGWFAGCQDAVVASATATGHRCVVHVRDRAPGRRCMAGITCFRRCNVIGWLHGRKNSANRGVAAGASWPGTLENPTGVASVASDILVCAEEVKTGAEMVKGLLCVRRRCKQQHAENNWDKRLHWIRCTSSKESLEWHRPQSKPNSPL